MISLKNKNFTLCAKSQGAELVAVFSEIIEKELLWQANPQIWPRHAPVLFPIVGKLKNNEYIFKGKKYSLPQHGFARDVDFTLVEKQENKMVFELVESIETLKHYPFHFRLRISYELTEDGFKCNYEVLNTGSENMFFSIGSHPGFICPLFEHESLEDYAIRFEKDTYLDCNLIEGGLISPKTRRIGLNEQKALLLDKHLFNEDALVLKSLLSSSMCLQSKKYKLSFSWHNMPYFGIWSKPGAAGFVCLEPWAGIADNTETSGLLEEKEGILCLCAGKKYECGFEVQFSVV